MRLQGAWLSSIGSWYVDRAVLQESCVQREFTLFHLVGSLVLQESSNILVCVSLEEESGL